MAERFFRRMVGDSAWDRLPEETKEARRADGPALAGEIAAIRTTVAPFDVGHLAVPAVFGRGTESLPHQRASADWLVAHTPDAELIEIEGAAPRRPPDPPRRLRPVRPDRAGGTRRPAVSR